MQATTLSAENQRHADGLAAAMAAIAHLNDQGSTVLSIKLTGRRPVIQIQRPTSPFLQGCQRMRVRTATGYRMVKSAPVHGCQVEWFELVYAEERAHG